MVRQITGTARIPSPGQHGVGGEASSGAVSYPLQREGPADVPVLERDDFVPIQATDDVRVRTDAERAGLRSAYDEQPTWLHARTRLLLATLISPSILSQDFVWWCTFILKKVDDLF